MENDFIWVAELLKGKNIVAIGDSRDNAIINLYDRCQHDFKGRLKYMDFNEFVTLSTLSVTAMIPVDELFKNEKENKTMNRNEVLENRLNIIKNKAERDRQEKIAREREEEKRIDDLIDQVNSMEDRIQDIINLANACIKSKISIPRKGYYYGNYDSGKKYGYPHEFVAEGIRHHVGLIVDAREYDVLNHNYSIKYIGINNGGANGKYDFHTDGHYVYHVHEDNNSIKRPTEYDLEKFLKEFPEFEKGFLNWIDSLGK